MKTCTRCKREKPLNQFYRNKGTKDGRASHCKRCAADCGNATTARKRREVMMALGGMRCVRCNIDDERVLVIDHIHGGGSQHRRQPLGAGYGYYKRMLDNLEDYQVLCWNCNHIKRLENKEHTRAVLIV